MNNARVVLEVVFKHTLVFLQFNLCFDKDQVQAVSD
jgi:hypothetical protein